jgi:hypothetical protein
MNAVRAALRGDSDQPTHIQAVFRGILREVRFEFLHGAFGEILAGFALLRPSVAHTIDHESVGVKIAATANLHVIVETARSVLGGAGFEQREIQILAGVDRKRVNLLLVYQTRNVE